jgi:glucose/mannose-6-phosphate isomerase
LSLDLWFRIAIVLPAFGTLEASSKRRILLTEDAYVMPMTLDDVAARKQFDKSNMLQEMENAPSRLKPPADAETTFSNSFDVPRNIVIGGVGGSGIAGDIVTDYVKTRSTIPISVCRAYNLPTYVDKDTLFLAISYSGETHETLNLLEEAHKRRAKVATVTSGGRMLVTSLAKKIPYLKVTSGLPPRVALPELLAAALFALGKATLSKEPETILHNASSALATEIQSIKCETPTNDNKAKQMAERLHDRLPLLLGPEERVSVLRRFKNELNENSKIPAVYMCMPECYHDDIEGLESLISLASVQPVLLRTWETGHQPKTVESLVALMKELGFPPIMTFQGHGEDVLSELLTAITFGDFVSVYLALLRRIDPTTLLLIPKFRAAAAS